MMFILFTAIIIVILAVYYKIDFFTTLLSGFAAVLIASMLSNGVFKETTVYTKTKCQLVDSSKVVVDCIGNETTLFITYINKGDTISEYINKSNCKVMCSKTSECVIIEHNKRLDTFYNNFICLSSKKEDKTYEPMYILLIKESRLKLNIK